MKNILVFPVILFCCLLSSLESAAQKKYNVIFIAADDLSIAFDAYGNPDAKMPNFARLMQHGTWFKQTYVQYPLCSPSRTSMLSGKRPDSTGVFENEINPRTYLGADYRFLPEYFHDNGYRTETFGKVGPCSNEDAVTWDYVFKGEIGNVFGFKDDPTWWIDTTVNNEHETKDGIIMDTLIKKIRQPVARPYFYGIGLSTHNPFTPILSTWNRIGDSSVQDPMLLDEKGTTKNIFGNGSGNILLPNTPADDLDDIPSVALKQVTPMTPYETQQMRHAYYAEIEALDMHLGVLLDELDASNLWDSTVVIFWSDHGSHSGEHFGQWLKLTLFEESLRVPFIVCAPGLKANSSVKPVENIDIFPTLAELCSLPTPPLQEGSSLVPLMEKPTITWKKAVFAQRFLSKEDTFRMGRSVRTINFHYNFWQEFGEELYDIVNDPQEYTNLSNNPAYHEQLIKMRELLANGWQAALPPVYTKHSFYRDQDGDGYGKKKDSLVRYFVPDGYVDKYGDCNDQDPNIHPGADDKPCNGIDDNCDGKIDETKPQPTITAMGNLDICAAGSVVLKTNTHTGFTFQWKKNGNNIAGATQSTYTATTTGTYKVVITYKDVCNNKSDGIVVTSSCNADPLTDEISQADKLIVSPNPSTGNITAKYNSINTGNIDLKIYNKIGNLVFSKKDAAKTGANLYQLNLSNLKSDIYNLEITNGSQHSSVTFIIEK